ncbi:hypothetical protein CsSME_00040271 [Camellia sinensis var. sinensis]
MVYGHDAVLPMEINIMSLRVKCQDHLRGSLVEGRAGSIGIGEEENDSSVASIVLATSKSREDELELGSKGRIGVPLVPPPKVPSATEVGVATDVLS